MLHTFVSAFNSGFEAEKSTNIRGIKIRFFLLYASLTPLFQSSRSLCTAENIVCSTHGSQMEIWCVWVLLKYLEDWKSREELSIIWSQRLKEPLKRVRSTGMGNLKSETKREENMLNNACDGNYISFHLNLRGRYCI